MQQLNLIEVLTPHIYSVSILRLFRFVERQNLG
jgi:hypothetical protein